MNKKNVNEYTEYEKKLNEYYWKCFFSEFSKTCLFFAIFIFLGLVPEYIVALITLIILRSNGGGLHFEHYLSCLTVSFIFIYSSILLSKYVTPPQNILYISILLCVLIGYHLVPITSSNRPPATYKQTQRSKRNTAIIILLFFIMICICPTTSYVYICYWTIILHILQLIIACLKEVKKNV